MKALNVIFNTALAVIALSFVMTIYTAVQLHRSEKAPAPISIPTPAMPR